MTKWTAFKGEQKLTNGLYKKYNPTDRRHSATVNLLITIHEIFICLFLRNINKTIYSDITIDEKPDCCPSRWYTQSAHSFPQSVPTTSDTQTPRTIIHMQLLYAREAMV